MSPRNEEQNTQIKDERREQILSAALRLFAVRGFAAAKISDIVSAGGFSHGLVYHYFKSKEEIFYELLKRAMTTSSQSLLMVENMQLSPIEKVRAIAAYILNAIASFEDTAYYFLIIVHASVMEDTDEEKSELLGMSSIAFESMQRILAEGQLRNEIVAGDINEMSITFFSAIQGLAIYKLTIKDFKMPDSELLVNIVRKT